MRRIFVQIAAYRDELLLDTLKSAFINAKHSSRLSFGICLQDEAKAIEPLKTFANVRIKFINYHKTKGIGWARHQAQKLYDGEDYSMQVDSHMRFAPNWDRDAIKMHQQCESNKAFLTQFCPDWHKVSSAKLFTEIPTPNAAYKFDGKNYPHYLHIYPRHELKPLSKPTQHAFICAHFIFGPGRLFEEVPIDPQVGYFYEENNMTLRAWTNGWDIYLPNKMIARHTWWRKSTWDAECAARFEADRIRSVGRFLRLIGIQGPPLQEFTLGNERTLAQYHRFSGVDFINQTIEEHAKVGEVCL